MNQITRIRQRRPALARSAPSGAGDSSLGTFQSIPALQRIGTAFRFAAKNPFRQKLVATTVNAPSATDPISASTIEAINRFNEAFNRRDVAAIMYAMTDDCVFENTRPAPDGERIVGQRAVRAFWEKFFERSPEAVFTTEDIFAAGDRGVVRWRYDWVREGNAGHVRGVDVFRVREGKVAEKLSYVKG